MIREARAAGRSTALVTASPQKVADAVANHLGLFDTVLASSDTQNVSHRIKAKALVDRFGARGFDYIGNSSDDLPVFEVCRRATLVSSNQRLRRRARRANQAIGFFENPRGSGRTWGKALRVHQWLKNLLIFVPALAAGRILELGIAVQAALAFVSFSLLASAVYLVNDMIDLQSDRVHRTKCRRPFASGRLPVAAGFAAVPILIAASLLLTSLLPPLFLIALLGYAVATTLYTFLLKQQVIVDIMMLAGLYTMRILAGSAATDIQPSFWLLAFSMFVFFCLAAIKRYSELRLALQQDKPLAGRGYLLSDLPVILAIGASSGLISVLILALYTQSLIVPETYPARGWIWLVPPLLLYWVARLWLKAGRGEIDDDPVLFAAKDWQSLGTVGLAGLLFVLARSGWWPF